MIDLSNDICRLEYNEKQRSFHFENSIEKDCRKNGWVWLKMMSISDCIDFCDFMNKKYVNGRVTGILPELSIVKLELSLFFVLKKYRRKRFRKTHY